MERLQGYFNISIKRNLKTKLLFGILHKKFINIKTNNKKQLRNTNKKYFEEVFMYNFRTDLALERRDIYQKQNKLKEIDGIESTEEEINDVLENAYWRIEGEETQYKHYLVGMNE